MGWFGLCGFAPVDALLLYAEFTVHVMRYCSAVVRVQSRTTICSAGLLYTLCAAVVLVHGTRVMLWCQHFKSTTDSKTLYQRAFQQPLQRPNFSPGNPSAPSCISGSARLYNIFPKVFHGFLDAMVLTGTRGRDDKTVVEMEPWSSLVDNSTYNSLHRHLQPKKHLPLHFPVPCRRGNCLLPSLPVDRTCPYRPVPSRSARTVPSRSQNLSQSSLLAV